MEAVSTPRLAMVAADKENNLAGGTGSVPSEAEKNMAKLMEKLNLTYEEATTVILEDENEED